jgi:diaminohydroxyphosphoribosylaminopyrimidine deaminase/5-amino-6-(5-phosphoribosylamino)uracil reductase
VSLDTAFMRLAIEQARAHHGLTAPNPSVGCVLVRDGTVLASAATAPGGRPHAEEQALDAAGDAARGATAYVTLEPCGARSAGTASCAQRLAQAGVARVVIACEDPSPFASGQGIERLAAAGIDLDTGILAGEAEFLYAAWREAVAREAKD